jgi:hypothetical protein
MKLARQAKPAYAAILRVSPAPESLVYSSAVFNKLNLFGEVTSFKKLSTSLPTPSPKQLHASEQQEYRVEFSAQSALHHALSESPFTVDVDHNLPRPEGLDPYNVFGLQFRKRPEPRSFTCQVTEEQGENAFYNTSFTSDANFPAPPKLRLVKNEKTGLLYKSLVEAGVPLGQLEGLATSMEPALPDEAVNENVSPNHTLDKDVTSTNLARAIEFNVSPGPNPPRLMEIYRSALRRSLSNQGSPVASPADGQSETSVPIRRIVVKPRYQYPAPAPRSSSPSK